MPFCEVAIVSPPSLHHYYTTILSPYSFCLVDSDTFKISPQSRSELVVIDCEKFHEKGLSILSELKNRHTDIPIIFITSIGSEEIVRRAYRSGARDYFKRPFDEAEFKGVVDSLLEFKLENRERRNSHLLKPQTILRKLPERLLRAIDFIDQGFENREIYLNQVAAEACLSKYHFIRLFKKHFGMTPMQYVSLKRVEKAKSLLRTTHDTISHVAFQSGFNEIAEFNRHFKKSTGLTPSEFRANAADIDQTNSL